MKLTPPKVVTWWIAVILGVLGLLGTLVTIPFVSANAFWFVFVGFALLVLATLLKDL
jgi:membrane protein YdbS with pleckstrin-like domain